MHIGILGTGFGAYHGQIYKKLDPSIQLTFWGRNAEKLKEIQNSIQCEYTTDLEQFLSTKSFDFVDICLPSQLHTTYALKTLSHHHSIFLETPAVLSIEEGLEIANYAKNLGKKVLVNMFLQYDPYYQLIKTCLENKNYGDLKHLSIFRKTPPLWGPLGTDKIGTSLMIHDLDFAMWIEKNLSLSKATLISNTENTGAVVDCLLSNDTLNVHVHGNSMLPETAPFSVGYEAIFEKASISYFEESASDLLNSKCCIYTNNTKENLTFELLPHCEALLDAVIKDMRNEKPSNLSLENALNALNIAFKLKI